MGNTAIFAAGTAGNWSINKISSVVGDSLRFADQLMVSEFGLNDSVEGVWALKGFRSNIRYASRPEVHALAAVQAGLGRPQATCAALIPIRKTAAWWDLAQDERRSIIEEESRHIGIGMEYLPAISRRLYHCRDLGEPFDFLTWFEYAPEHAGEFEMLVDRLRSTDEWSFVDREVDIRLSRILSLSGYSPSDLTIAITSAGSARTRKSGSTKA